MFRVRSEARTLLGLRHISEFLFLEAEAELLELRLHLVYRLLAEVADLEEVLFRLLNEVTDRGHTLALEAVVRPDGQIHVFDRLGEHARGLFLTRLRTEDEPTGSLPQPGEELEQLDESGPRRRQGV